MNARAVADISQRLSLRAPQRESLDVLARIAGALALPSPDAPPDAFRAIKAADRAAQLAAIQGVVPTLTDFDRAFPSFCFALATGVGKTRLMGAAIAYLRRVHGIRHFFVVAPNLTIYDKLRTDFTPNTPKYVFEGLGEFVTEPPVLVDADNWDTGRGVRDTDLFGDRSIHINIFNIARFASDDGRRMRTTHEVVGEAYFKYLSELPDLVVLMDESHRYRASAAVKALDELNPLLGIELSATPQLAGRGARPPVRFSNIAFDYPLARAIQDGFVKSPAVATREDFRADGIDPAQLERIKLEDALVLHTQTKAELQAYARNMGVRVVKPFVLVIARDTMHAEALQRLIESPDFHGGIYSGHVITVHSNRTGAEKDEVVQRLLNVERPDEPTQIVIHVEMLKEGWDVTNLYTIVPLRAADSRTLVEQSIGRGLRLPYGRRTGVEAVDRLTIVAHDHFEQIVDEANRGDSPFRVQTIVIGRDVPADGSVATYVPSLAEAMISPPAPRADTPNDAGAPAPVAAPASVFTAGAEQEIARTTFDVLAEYEHLASSRELSRPDVQSAIVDRVKRVAEGAQIGLGLDETLIPAVVTRVVAIMQENQIDIPRVVIQPVGGVRVTYAPFELDVSGFRYPVPEQAIIVEHLQTHARERIEANIVATEDRPENYVVRELINAPDIDYEAHADRLYEIAGTVVNALREYVPEDQLDIVLSYYQRDIGARVLAQLREHRREEAESYKGEVTRGFVRIAGQHATSVPHEPIRSVHEPVDTPSRIRSMRFGHLARCLHPEQRFHSDPERRFAWLLERDNDQSIRWVRPSQQDIHIYLAGDARYVPDFVVETSTGKYLVEVKDEEELDDEVVQAKARAAAEWCRYATEHSVENGGKPWSYLLVPDAEITANATFAGVAGRFVV